MSTQLLRRHIGELSTPSHLLPMYVDVLTCATHLCSKYNDQILELVISCLYLAAIVACLPCEYITRTYGRKVGPF